MAEPPAPDEPDRPWDKNRPRDDRGERRRREDDEDQEEDRPRRRRRDDDEDDWDDDRPRRRRRRYDEPEPDPAMKFVVPMNTSALAILAGYVGLVSVLCVPAPFALLLGILALQHLKKNPKLDGKGRAIFAIVMGALFSIPLVIGLVSIVIGGMK